MYLVITLMILINYSVFSEDYKIDISELQSEITKLKIDAEKQQIEYNKQLKELDETLNDLRAKSNTNKNISERITALENKQLLLEKKSNDERVNDLNILKTRYLAGVVTSERIISKLRTLSNAYALALLHSDYNSLSNPNNYNEYKSKIEEIKEYVGDEDVFVSKIDFHNSLINSIYSISAFLLNIENDDDDLQKQKAEDLLCIMDFTLEAAQ